MGQWHVLCVTLRHHRSLNGSKSIVSKYGNIYYLWLNACDCNIFRQGLSRKLTNSSQDLTLSLQEKFCIILTLPRRVMTPDFLKNCKRTFGNSERSSEGRKSGYLHFGTKTKKPKP